MEVNKKILFVILILIIIIFMIFFTNKNLNSNNKEEREQQEQVEQLKEQLGITGNSHIYTIQEEYDGRKVLTIKPEIRYSIALAGIIKNDKPEYSEIDKLLESEPKGSGIWVNVESRDRFLEMLKLITKSEYKINDNGFLIIENQIEANDNDKKLQQIISSNKLFVVDINNKFYSIDEVTGEIIEYPFEDMDPYTPLEYIEMENKTILIITTNSKNKQNEKDIISEIIENVII